jgi:hypothetical protein
VQASFTHYTWGALIYEGLQSQGGKNIYKWDKREYSQDQVRP